MCTEFDADGHLDQQSRDKNGNTIDTVLTTIRTLPVFGNTRERSGQPGRTLALSYDPKQRAYYKA